MNPQANRHLLNKRTNALLALWSMVCFCVLALPHCEAQNLVPNPSFEVTDTCPYTIGFQDGDRPLYWNSWLESPEYFNACAGSLNDIDSVVGVPRNGFGFQYAFDGVAYVGMYTYKEDYREYVGCELINPLVVGETYQLSFYANMATCGNYWDPKWASNNIGMLFTVDPNVWDGMNAPPFPFRDYAHLYSSEVIADTAGWVLVTGSFVADSAYRYLVLGNFFSDALTDTAHVAGSNSLGAYYFVDGVCVTQAGLGCEFGLRLDEHFTPDFNLWPNPMSDGFWVKGFVGNYEVINAMGVVVYKGEIHPGYAQRVDTYSWPIGRYVLRHQGEKVVVMQLVVMH